MITIFESYKNTREVDLNELYNDMYKYSKELNIYTRNINIEFEYIILSSLIQNKLISFQKVKNPIDDEESYNMTGIVQWYKIHEWNKRIENSKFLLDIQLKDDNNTYRLATQDYGNVFRNAFKPTILIHNNHLTDIEKKLNLIKETEKYNL